MSESTPRKSAGDHLHLAARVVISSIPVIGGPALELFNAAISGPIDRRKNEWLDDIAGRLCALEKEQRLRVEDLAENEEFISALMQATVAAVRSHHQEKKDALRSAVLNSALGQCPSDVKSALFVALVDQFTVWHLMALKAIYEFESQGQYMIPKTSVNEIAQVVARRVAGLRDEPALAEMVAEELCRKGLLFWGDGQGVIYIPRGTSQVTPLGKEFLQYVSGPDIVKVPGDNA